MPSKRTIDLTFAQIAHACQVAAVDLEGIADEAIETVQFTLMQDDGGQFFGRVEVTLKPNEPIAALELAA